MKFNRSDWASLDWQAAQKEVAKMLNQYGFMTFEEKRLRKSSRTDVLVIHNSSSKITFGIVEVKTYSKVTPGLEKKAFKQATGYLKTWYKIIRSNQRWGNKTKQFFIATVFTKDYPTSFNKAYISNLINKIPKAIREHTSFISSTPNTLISTLIERNIIPKKQSKLDDFF